MQVLGSLRSVLWDAAQLPGAASCDFSSRVVWGSPDQGEGCSAAGRRLKCVHSGKRKCSGPGHEQRTCPSLGRRQGSVSQTTAAGHSRGVAVHTTASPGQLTQPPALEEASRSTADSCGQWGTQGSELRVKGCFTGKNTWTFWSLKLSGFKKPPF